MTNLVVVFPKAEDAGSIRRLLLRSGYSTVVTCTSGTGALQAADTLQEGIVICGYRYRDMMYDELYGSLPDTFRMLLLASERVIAEGVPEGISSICMPLKVRELTDMLDRLSCELEYIRKRKRRFPRIRSNDEQRVIREAKCLLMERNGMSEGEAHRYLQKTSMESGTNLSETAQMLLRLMQD